MSGVHLLRRVHAEQTVRSAPMPASLRCEQRIARKRIARKRIARKRIARSVRTRATQKQPTNNARARRMYARSSSKVRSFCRNRAAIMPQSCRNRAAIVPQSCRNRSAIVAQSYVLGWIALSGACALDVPVCFGPVCVRVRLVFRLLWACACVCVCAFEVLVAAKARTSQKKVRLDPHSVANRCTRTDDHHCDLITNHKSGQ